MGVSKIESPVNCGVVPYTRLQTKNRKVSETNRKSSERRLERDVNQGGKEKKKMTKD
jgi:hypothetical protein